MADTQYFRSPTRRELREKKMERQETRKAQVKVLSALDAVLKNGAVYEEPEVALVTEIPDSMLPKNRKTPKTPPANAASKANPFEPVASSTVVSTEKKLPLSWEVTHHGKNDLSTVQSKLTYTKGQGEVPPNYFPEPEQNRRKSILEQRQERESKKVKASEKPVKPFEYQPKVTKLAPGEQPRVVTLPTSPSAGSASLKSPVPRPSSAAAHAKPFR